MTRLFLAAGVAALAISAPVGAKPDRERGGQSAQTERGGKDRAARPQRQQRAERPQRAEKQQRVTQRAERPQRAERQQRVAQRAERPQRAERRVERAARPNRAERAQTRVADRQHNRANRAEQAQTRVADRQQQQRVNTRQADRRELRAERRDTRQDLRAQRIDNRIDRREIRNERFASNSNRGGVGFGVGGCPPGLASKGCMPPGQAKNLDRMINADAFRTSRLATLASGARSRFVNPYVASRYLGQPVSAVSQLAALSVLPQSVRYLYPDTDDYYYRYGGGYAYRVGRDNDLIDYILPLLAGGYMPGQYLPSSYMNSYVPDYYGLNSFYPASYGSYGGNGYGYDYDVCNRYYGGVVYQVECGNGLIQDVVPLYASGYGVGQLLPNSYGYYNVPSQYRSLYYNSGNSNYWYAPGAIYQYDRSSSLITSVAALLTPGFGIGQQLPVGYGMYNVPMAYRSSYYDTPNDWYRYNNGGIYRVDPTTQLVTALVASILT